MGLEHNIKDVIANLMEDKLFEDIDAINQFDDLIKEALEPIEDEDVTNMVTELISRHISRDDKREFMEPKIDAAMKFITNKFKEMEL